MVASRRSEPTNADQRARLLEAIVGLTATAGYTELRVGDLASTAGVSRATFYEQFVSKEGCFLAAHDELSKQLVADIDAALVAKARAGATQRVVCALARFAAERPDAFSFLTYEALLAGPSARDRRGQLIAGLSERLERALAESKRAQRALEVPAWMLLGGAVRVLGIRARRGPASGELASELAAWVASYETADVSRRATRFVERPHFLDGGKRLGSGVLPPEPLPRGRHRLPVEVVRRVQRERILHATARVIQAKGYPNTTVADIVASAGVSREVFYSHFHSRSAAFIETHQLVFEQMMAATAGAFFASTGPWPERVWQSAIASTEFVLEAPSFAHFAFVESYALGSAVAARTDDAVLAFTALLAQGASQRPAASDLPKSVSDAIVGAIMEAVAEYVSSDRPEEIANGLPILTYMIVAPFMGAKRAGVFVDEKVGEQRTTQGDR